MNEHLTDERPSGAERPDLEAIKARVAAATEGPWEWDDTTIGQHWSHPEPRAVVVDDEVSCMDYCYGGSSNPIKSDADGQFIAHAREDIPALVVEVERLRAQLDNPRDEYHTMVELKSWRHADGELFPRLLPSEWSDT